MRGDDLALPPVSARAAIVHDWLPLVGGAERVLADMVRVCPNSEIFTTFDFLSEAERAEVSLGVPVHASGLNRLPMVQRYYRNLLMGCTRAVEGFDVTGHDVVLSSSAAFAKGVITSPEQMHIGYVHSPARYAWDLSHAYIGAMGGVAAPLKRAIARRMMHRFRMWDARTAAGVDTFVANSAFIAKRIKKVYRREAVVIHPPVDTAAFTMGGAREDVYVTASRMVPYKNIPMIVAAFAERPHLKLRVLGDGPDMGLVRKLAGPNVEVCGYVDAERMRAEMQRAKAFVFAAKEDFGIVPVEAQACGTPVICLDAGGTAETVRPLGETAPTGVWFSEQTREALLGAVDMFEAEGDAIRAEDCRANALRFSAERFREELRGLIYEVAGV